MLYNEKIEKFQKSFPFTTYKQLYINDALNLTYKSCEFSSGISYDIFTAKVDNICNLVNINYNSLLSET